MENEIPRGRKKEGKEKRRREIEDVLVGSNQNQRAGLTSSYYWQLLATISDN